MYDKFEKREPFSLLDTSKYPPEVVGRFNSFITTQFDDSLSVEMQMRSIIKWAIDNFKLMDDTYNDFTEYILNGNINPFIEMLNDLIEYMNYFIETFDERYQETILDKMQEWYDNGELETLINESLDTKYHEMDERLTTQLTQTNILNVKQFGVIGDGVTDDTENLQLALDSAVGKTLIIDRTDSFYKITDTLVIPSNTTIIGYNVPIIKFPNNTVFKEHRSPMLLIEDSRNIVISGLELDGNMLNQATHKAWSHGINFLNAENVEITHCYIHSHKGDGIGLSGPDELVTTDNTSKNISINNNTITKNGRNGVSVIHGEKVDIVSNYIAEQHAYASLGAGIDIEPNFGPVPWTTRNISVSRNTVTENYVGVQIHGSPYDSNSKTIIENISIIDNKVYNNIHLGNPTMSKDIALYHLEEENNQRVKGIIISNNTVGQSENINGASGIWVTRVDTNVLIMGNTIANVDKPIYLLQCKNLVVSNNNIDDYGTAGVGSRGILLIDVNNSTFTNNVITNGISSAGEVTGIMAQALSSDHINNNNIIRHNIIRTTKENGQLFVGIGYTSNNVEWESAKDVIIEYNIVDNVEKFTRGVQLVNVNSSDNQVGINKINRVDHRFTVEPVRLVNIRTSTTENIDFVVNLDVGEETEKEILYISVNSNSHVILTPKIAPVGVQITYYTHNGTIRVRVKNVGSTVYNDRIDFNVLIFE